MPTIHGIQALRFRDITIAFVNKFGNTQKDTFDGAAVKSVTVTLQDGSQGTYIAEETS